MLLITFRFISIQQILLILFFFFFFVKKNKCFFFLANRYIYKHTRTYARVCVWIMNLIAIEEAILRSYVQLVYPRGLKSPINIQPGLCFSRPCWVNDNALVYWTTANCKSLSIVAHTKTTRTFFLIWYPFRLNEEKRTEWINKRCTTSK